ncbi:MAG: hypothetical protein CMP22_06000 [Rickettsiales bacterium]|nr:hypothetical protein [Rickettsiales bacterium]
MISSSYSFAMTCEKAHHDGFKCETDSDCVQVIGPCGFPKSANKSYSDVIQICYEEFAKMVHCKPMPADLDYNDYINSCVDNLCVSNLKK